MDNELFQEIQSLKKVMESVSHRLEALEQIAARTDNPAPMQAAAPSSNPAETPQMAASEPEDPAQGRELSSALEPRSAGPELNSSPPEPAAREQGEAPLTQESSRTEVSYPRLLPAALEGRAAVQPAQPIARESLELWIGRNLNKIGIFMVVLGCAFGIIYEFQYFTPWLKILSGLLTGGALLAAGEWFERRTSIQWYGRAITGGGWSLLYFTIYAAHHFESVKVIGNPLIDLFLLLLTAVGAVWHSLRSKSETITSISLSLGFITTCLSEISFFTLFSSALLLASLAWLVVSMGWFDLYIYGLLSFYALYLFAVVPQIWAGQTALIPGLSIAEGHIWLTVGFSTFCWAAFSGILFGLERKPSKKHPALIVGTLVNSLVFVPTVLTAMGPEHASLRFPFLLSVGLSYLLSVPVDPSRRRLLAVGTIHTLLGLLFVMMAIPCQLAGHWLSMLWLLEVPLLVWTGLRYALPAVRVFAVPLSLLALGRICLIDLPGRELLHVLAWHLPSSVIIAALAMGCFALASACCWRAARTNTTAIKDDQAFHFYLLLASTAAIVVTALHASKDWLSLLYSLESAALILLGFRLRDSFLRVTGGIGIYALAVQWLLLDTGGWPIPATVAVVAILYALGDRYDVVRAEEPLRQKGWVRLLYDGTASLLLTMLLAQIFSVASVPLAWMCEALILLGLGFYWQDQMRRVSALCVLALVATRLAAVNFWCQDAVSIFGLQVTWRLLTGLAAVCSFGLAALLYRLPRLREIVGQHWSPGFHFNCLCAYLIALILPTVEGSPDWQPLLCTLASAIMLLLGLRIDDAHLRGWAQVGLFVFLLGLFPSSWGHWPPLATAGTIGILYALSYRYRMLLPQALASFEEGVQSCYSISGSVLLTALLYQEVSSQWLALSWALAGAALLVAGFTIGDKLLRLSGLTLFGLLTLKLLFIDLAHAETIQRIVSFIVAGLLLLGASYAYALFTTKTKADRRTVLPPWTGPGEKDSQNTTS